MKEKIQLLIKNEGLTQSRLAEMLEIQPANVSHILAGRSKPGFELLQKILRRFPRINPDWLLLDSAEMYRADAEVATTTPNLDPSRPLHERPAPNFDSLFPGTGASVVYPSSPDGAMPSAATTSGSPSDLPTAARPHGTVARVVVFYTDHTFESFEPKG